MSKICKFIYRNPIAAFGWFVSLMLLMAYGLFNLDVGTFQFINAIAEWFADVGPFIGAVVFYVILPLGCAVCCWAIKELLEMAKQQGVSERYWTDPEEEKLLTVFAALERDYGLRCYLYGYPFPVQIYIVIPGGCAIYWRERSGWYARWTLHFNPEDMGGTPINWEANVIAEGCEGYGLLDAELFRTTMVEIILPKVGIGLKPRCSMT